MVGPSKSLNLPPSVLVDGLLVYSKPVVMSDILLLFQYILSKNLLLTLNFSSLATPSTSNFTFLSLAHLHQDFALFGLEIQRAGCKGAGDKRP